MNLIGTSVFVEPIQSAFQAPHDSIYSDGALRTKYATITKLTSGVLASPSITTITKLALGVLAFTLTAQAPLDLLLVVACRHSMPKLALLAINLGANVDLRLPIQLPNRPITDLTTIGYLIKHRDLETLKAVLPYSEIGIEDAACILSACEDGDYAMIDYLLEEGLDPNTSWKQETLLYTAVESENPALVERVLKSGANPNPGNVYRSPLESACMRGNLEIVKLLVRYGAHVNERVDGRKESESMYLAALNGHKRIVSYLYRNGGYPPESMTRTRTNKKILETLIRDQVLTEKEVFSAAITYGNIEMATYILENTENPKLMLSSPSTISVVPDHLAEAVYNAMKLTDSTYNARTNTWTSNVSAVRAREAIIDLLLEYGAKVNGKALNEACYNGGSLKIAKKLVEHGADINGSSGKDSPLLGAVICENNDLITYLIEQGAKPDLFQCLERVWSSKPDTTKYILPHANKFLDLGADINGTDEAGETLLFRAARENRTEVIEWLLKKGIDPTITNKEGVRADQLENLDSESIAVLKAS